MKMEEIKYRGGNIMAWIDYYNLLIKYAGDLTRATRSEVIDVILKNNTDPDIALRQARQAYNKTLRGE